MAWFPHLFSKLGRLGSAINQALLLAGINRYAEFGFTTAQEGHATAEAVATEAALAGQGKLKMDVVAYPDIQGAASAISGPFLSKNYTGRFRIGGAKLTLDGSPQGKTASLTEPYRVPPAGRGHDYPGSPAMTDEEANAFVDEAFKNGWQIPFTATAMRRRISSSRPCVSRPRSTAPGSSAGVDPRARRFARIRSTR